MRRLVREKWISVSNSVVRSSLFILVVNISSLIYSTLWIMVIYEILLMSRSKGLGYRILLVPVIYVGWKIYLKLGVLLVTPFVESEDN